jgi:hypothetical protein
VTLQALHPPVGVTDVTTFYEIIRHLNMSSYTVTIGSI